MHMTQAFEPTVTLENVEALTATQILNFTEHLVDLHPDQIPRLLNILETRINELSEEEKRQHP